MLIESCQVNSLQFKKSLSDKVTGSLQPQAHFSCHASVPYELSVTAGALPVPASTATQIEAQALHANSHSLRRQLNFKGLQQIMGLHNAAITSFVLLLCWHVGP